MNTKLTAIAGILILLTLTACKKSEAPAPNTTDTPSTQAEVNSNQPDTQAPEEEIKEDTVIPPATDKISCKNWNNALFVDGSEFHYKIIHRRSGPKFEEEPDYVPEYEFYATCHVKLKYASDTYCGSDVTCELDPEYNNDKYKRIIDPIHLDTMWFVDKNAYYTLPKDNFKLIKTPRKGRCEYIKYIKCEPGTLAWEYKPFNETEQLIPLRPEMKIDEVTKEFMATIKTSVTRTGSVLCRHGDAIDEYGNRVIGEVCIDDIKGLTILKDIETLNGSSFSFEYTLITK